MCDLCGSDCGNYDEAHGFCGHGTPRQKIDELIIKISDAYRRGRRGEAIRGITADRKSERRKALQSVIDEIKETIPANERKDFEQGMGTWNIATAFVVQVAEKLMEDA